MGINNYYACYLEDLCETKPIKGNNYSLVCINKSEFKRNIVRNKEPSSTSNYQNYSNS